MQAARSRVFWHLALMLFLGDFLGYYIATDYKLMAQNTLSDRSLTIAGAIGALGNGVIRPIWGMLRDKFGFKTIYTVVMLI